MKTMRTASRNGDIMGTWDVWFAIYPDFASFVTFSPPVGCKPSCAGCNPSGMGTFQAAGVDKAVFSSEHGIGTFMGQADDCFSK